MEQFINVLKELATPEVLGAIVSLVVVAVRLWGDDKTAAKIREHADDAVRAVEQMKRFGSLISGSVAKEEAAKRVTQAIPGAAKLANAGRTGKMVDTGVEAAYNRVKELRDAMGKREASPSS